MKKLPDCLTHKPDFVSAAGAPFVEAIVLPLKARRAIPDQDFTSPLSSRDVRLGKVWMNRTSLNYIVATGWYRAVVIRESWERPG